MYICIWKQGAQSPPFRQRDTLVQDYLGREGAEQFLSDWDEERSSRSSSMASTLSLPRGVNGDRSTDRASEHPLPLPPSPPPQPPPVSKVDTRRLDSPVVSSTRPVPEATVDDNVCLARLTGVRTRDGRGHSGEPTTLTPAETAEREAPTTTAS